MLIASCERDARRMNTDAEFAPVPAAFSVSVSAWSEPKTTSRRSPEPPPESTMSIPAVLPARS